MAQASIALTGQVTTTARVNVRQGRASLTAPVARKLPPGTMLRVVALVVGDAVEGNSHWYDVGDEGFVWAGGCGPFQQGAVPAPPPTDAVPTGDSGAITEAGLDGFGLGLPFATKLATLILECRSRGLMFRIGQGLRPPHTQALYYCQWAQRSPAHIDEQVALLRARSAPWTANLIHGLRDTHRITAWQTNALPGAGWHQWGEAADCYCYRDGAMVGNGADPSYATYAEIAESIGLTAGLRFSHPDPGHVQLRAAGGATDLYSWSRIDAEMKDRFGDKPGME